MPSSDKNPRQTFLTLFVCSILCLPFRPQSVGLRQHGLLTGGEGGGKTTLLLLFVSISGFELWRE